MQQQREIELKKEEQMKRALEGKEQWISAYTVLQNSSEIEKQLQLQWSKQRIVEMNAQNMGEQEKVSKLNQTCVELSTFIEKVGLFIWIYK